MKKVSLDILTLLVCFIAIQSYSFAATKILRQNNENLIVAPDPHVILDNGIYYMYATAGDGKRGTGFGTGWGDIPIWTATNIAGPWKKEVRGVFGYDGNGRGYSNLNLFVNNAWYRSIWGPDVIKLGANSYMLSFTASKHGHSITRNEAPGHREMGVYLAWSNSPKGPFAPYSHIHEPFPISASDSCPKKEALPHSVEWASPNCQGGYCENIVRLDVNIYKSANEYWMGYSWYTDDWYNGHLKGEHTSIVKLDSSDPFKVDCNASPIFIANSQDSNLINKLKLSCNGVQKCKEMLSFTKDKTGGEFSLGGVIEGPSIFKRGEYFYVLMSGSTWDSAFYHVYWIASKTIEGLAWNNPNRLVGRFLVPGEIEIIKNDMVKVIKYAFGTGSALKDKSGNWQYVYAGLPYDQCSDPINDCSRYALVSPITFEDKNDGKGKVHIKTIYPTEDMEPILRELLSD